MNRRAILTVLLTLSAFLALPSAASAQIVTVDKEYRVLEVDSTHRLLKVADAEKEGDKEDATVLVTSETKLFVLGKELPNFTWRLLRKGMKITVSGGMTWDLKVKAKQIHLL